MAFPVGTPRYSKILDEHDSPNFQTYQRSRQRSQRSPKSPLQYYESFSTPTKSDKRSKREIIDEFMGYAKENFNINDIEHFVHEIQESGFLKLASPRSSQREDQKNNFTCLICKNNAENIAISKCGHLFCYDCIHSHLQQNSTCPICNTRIKENDIIPVLAYNKDYHPAISHNGVFHRIIANPGILFFFIFIILTIFFAFKLQ